MKEAVKQLNPINITSDVFIISPAQLDYIAGVFSKNFADSMNMRTFSGRICEIAKESLRTALRAAKKMGEHK
ncbi:MAG: hypothetical protein J5742_01450 [Alphaproteobacteria bacterium]|nr:hypothetical protein [Alphaproteobacteria bacterium]